MVVGTRVAIEYTPRPLGPRTRANVKLMTKPSPKRTTRVAKTPMTRRANGRNPSRSTSRRYSASMRRMFVS